MPETLTSYCLPSSSGYVTAAAILLHGHGNNGNQLAQYAAFLNQALPQAVLYLPNAPFEVERGDPQRRRWFSLEDYDRNTARTDAAKRAAMFAAAPEKIADGAARLSRFIDQVQAHHHLSASRIALVGFSQGAMMALYAGLRRADQLAGILSYAGALFATGMLPAEIKSKPSVMLIHGEDDMVVPVETVADTKKALDAANVLYQAHTIPALQHGIDGVGAQIGITYLRGIFTV